MKAEQQLQTKEAECEKYIKILEDISGQKINDIQRLIDDLKAENEAKDKEIEFSSRFPKPDYFIEEKE